MPRPPLTCARMLTRKKEPMQQELIQPTFDNDFIDIPTYLRHRHSLVFGELSRALQTYDWYSRTYTGDVRWR